MGDLLKPGQKVLAGTAECIVEEFLGGGGQGEVYKCRLGNKSMALKWYFPQSATAEQRAGLELLVDKGPPNDKFLWPEELAAAPDVSGFGYVMPLREPRFRGILDLMKARIEPRFRELATAGMELAHSFFQLHAKGLCYCDISFGNAFFDPGTGEVKICDNDNVLIDGGKPWIDGTMKFMAPEVVRGEARPSSGTDRFSLAVLLFYMFMIHHPLEGAKEESIHAFDQAAMRKIYGEEPVFIFDPADTSNRPVPGYQDNAIIYWNIYPSFIKDLFVKAFTDGIKDPVNGRVVETVWRKEMLRLRDSIMYCPGCGSENFYDRKALEASGGQAPSCWKCRKTVPLPGRIRIATSPADATVVMLNHDTKLYPHHIAANPDRQWDFSAPVAEVTRHPTDPNRWGLKNVDRDKWTFSVNGGPVTDLPPGRSLPLVGGTKVNFGGVEGEIRFG